MINFALAWQSPTFLEVESFRKGTVYFSTLSRRFALDTGFSDVSHYLIKLHVCWTRFQLRLWILCVA